MADTGSGILIVDDLEFMRTAIRNILTTAGYRAIHEAVNGRDALMRYQAEKPAVVLLDIAMPEMDGLTALTRIRTLDPGARVIMCSALGEDSMIVRSIQLGARDFIVKPFRKERVLSAVGKALESDGTAG